MSDTNPAEINFVETASTSKIGLFETLASMIAMDTGRHDDLDAISNDPAVLAAHALQNNTPYTHLAKAMFPDAIETAGKIALAEYLSETCPDTHAPRILN